MKKIYCFIMLICLMLSFSNAFAQTYQRKKQTPNFFIPEQSLKTQNRQPDIHKQLAQKKRQQAYLKKLQQQKLSQQKARPAKSLAQKKQNTRKTSMAKTPASVAKSPQNIPIKTTKVAPIVPAMKNNAYKPIIDLPTATTIAELPVENTPFSIKPSKNSATENPFDMLWQDYQQDLNKIRRGISVNNPRLNKVLSDFKDKDHVYSN